MFAYTTDRKYEYIKFIYQYPIPISASSSLIWLASPQLCDELLLCKKKSNTNTYTIPHTQTLDHIISATFQKTGTLYVKCRSIM